MTDDSSFMPTRHGEAAVTEERRPTEGTVPLIRVRGVAKTYRRGSEEVRALRGVDLSLHPHEVVALVGPSGSGKSTLLNVLCGWEAPDEGEIEWTGQTPLSQLTNDGQPLVHAGGGLVDLPWSQIAILPQSLGLVEDLTVRENVELPVRLSGLRRERVERAANLIRALGLDALAERQPSQISVGEQQRSALARALVLSPRLLLADEPTGHQDQEWARGVFRAVRFAAREGSACLVATHHQEAVQFADRVVAIRDGHVREVPRGIERKLTAE
jgi:ABC-type lipoprotein export system ATPase subunit